MEDLYKWKLMWEEIKEHSWFSKEDFIAIERRYGIISLNCDNCKCKKQINEKGGFYYEDGNNRFNEINNRNNLSRPLFKDLFWYEV